MPCPTPFNLAEYVLAAGRETPRKAALEILGAAPQVWRFEKLTQAVRGVATGLLRAGLRPGDVALLRLGNTPDFPIAYLGAIAAGLIPVPTSSALSAEEITKMAAQVSPAVILQDAQIAAPDAQGALTISLDQLCAMYTLPPAPWHMGARDRAAYIVFTSGTSATPRAVVHAHRAIWARRMMHQDWYDLRASDRLLHAGAFNWTYTLGTGLMDPWTLGATALIPEHGTPPHALPALLARHNATLFAAAPGIFRKLLRADIPPLPALRHGLSAGEKMPVALHEQWYAKTGLRVYEAFGMSECSTFISSSPQRSVSPEALGRPQQGRRVTLRDDAGAETPKGEVGTIAVHRADSGLMLGYHRAPHATQARFRGDWFLTGDLGYQGEDGAIRYMGRTDDTMNAGGFRVSPLDVEAAFLGQHGIGQCAAVEMTLKTGVQIIALGYTAKQALQTSTLEALATATLARYKAPRIYHHCDTLPTSANGKLLRRVLRIQLEAQYGQT